MARYQLRLKRRKGRTAAKELASSCFMRMPLKKASGSQIREQIEFQKLSRTLRRLTKASTRSKRVLGSSPGRCSSSGVGVGADFPACTAGAEPMSNSLSCSTEAGTSIAKTLKRVAVSLPTILIPHWGVCDNGYVNRRRVANV